LGYSGDIGYQTFLYSSEIDIRRVLVFLIEKLPKESGKSIVEPTGENCIALLFCSMLQIEIKKNHEIYIPSAPNL
jgi:hypothetical protein